MGFKRTSEGRVFFQGADGSANDEPEKKSSQKSEQAPQQAGQYTQLQILTLLKGLNDKLKTTQAERNRMRKELDRYRDVIESIEEKSDKNEQAYLKLAQKLHQSGTAPDGNAEGRVVQAETVARETLKELKETRKLLLHLEEKTERADKGVSVLKKLQQEQAQKMAKGVSGYSQLAKRLQDTEARQEDMSGRIEEAITQQARLVRKIDKSIEDRARFMRKIERIEETVVQTRDSLNAKAMVLLTDQGAAAKVALEDPDDVDVRADSEPLLLEDGLRADGRTHQQSQASWSFFGAVAFGVVCILAGWFVSEMQKPDIPDLASIETQMISEAPIERAPPPVTQSQDWGVQEDTSRFAEQATQTFSDAETSYEPEPVDVGAADDIGTLTLQSDEELLSALEGNAAEVGEIMNQIEPGSDQQIIQESMQTASVDASASPAASAPVVSPAASNFKVEAPQAKGIPGSIKPDGSLPDVIKNIETQAFKGVPEAQHDLAAVYTAGHAGVSQDYGRASYWFKQAADQGIANASYNLGVLNHQGLGVKTDLDEAIRWYTQAAAQGHPEAQYNLGIAFIEGIGVPYDPVRAADYFETAAGKGITEAAYNLGLIYENGLLGQAQPDEALMWYKTAADAGSQEAKTALEQLAKTLNIKIEDINKLAESMKGADASAAQATSESQQQSSVIQTAPQPAAQEEPPVVSASISAPAIESFNTYGEQESQQALIAQVQEYLMRLGLYPGPADGVSGPLTSDAIRSYQSLNNLNADGEASNQLLSHMLANAGSTDAVDEYGSREY